MGWTTDELVAAVKLKAQAPASRWQFTDANVLDIAFQETVKRFIPDIREVREDYFTTYETIPLTNGVASYRIPKRASSMTIKQVLMVQTQANGRAWPVTRIATSEGWRGVGLNADNPYAYVIEGAQIRLVGSPTNASDYELRVYYQRRPSRYVTSDNTLSSRVVSVTDTTIVVSPTPSWWTSGTRIDVMSPEPDADLLIQGASVTLSTATFTITDGASTAQLTAGDYVAAADTTPIVLLPDVFFDALVDATTAECLRAIGDYDAAATIETGLGAYMTRVLASIAPRAESQILKAFNQQSPLRQRGYRAPWGVRS